jgi:NADPH:quinone reductase
MKAVGLYKHLPIEDPQSLINLDIQQPEHPTGRDLLVAIKAISINPLDTKVRRGSIPPTKNEKLPRILGWDAAGEVIAAGSDCTLFEKGDAVYYAGSISRPGTNCEFHRRRTHCWKKTKIT